MSLQYPEDVSQASTSDDEILNPEDMDLDDTAHVISSEGDLPNSDEVPVEESDVDDSEEEISDGEDDIFDADYQAEIDRVLRVYEYKQADRGVLKTAFVDGSPCNVALLQALLGNIKLLGRIHVCHALTGLIRFKDASDTMRAVMPGAEAFASAIISELSRLHKNPELFPSKDAEMEFWGDVYALCDRTIGKFIPRQKDSKKITRSLQAVGMKDQLDSALPKRDVQRTPWEQYLHNRAPGVEADLSAQGTGGSVQILPMAATRIVLGMVEENRAIITDIERQRADGTPYQDNPISSPLARREKLSPDGNLRFHQTSGDLLRPVLAGPTDTLRYLDFDSLELLNQDFATLTRRRAVLRPRLWNTLGVIIRELPNPEVASQRAPT